MMVGLAASGKSTVASMITVDRNGKKTTPHIHSSDALRSELYGDVSSQDHNNELFIELQRRIKEDLRSGHDVVYDATNIRKKYRIAFLKELAHIDCEKICVAVLTPYEICQRQNRERDRKVPENVIRRMYLAYCPPELNEGFDDIILAYNYRDMDYKRKFSLENFFEGEIGANYIDQENSHHSSTIGKHCAEAYEYVKDKYPKSDLRLRIAAFLHDIGKPFTKSHFNYKGEYDENCHYYNHNNCGAYDSFFYLNVLGIMAPSALYIANLIYYHMFPFLSWNKNEKAAEKVKARIGEKMFNDIMILHEADLEAH